MSELSATSLSALANDREAHWLPFTPNRSFKERPRLFARAEGMYYWDDQGRKILDAMSGLWCVNAGHGRKPIVEAIQKAAAELDYAPSLQFTHSPAFTLSSRILALAPKGFGTVCFCNSGSESVDSAMKIARGFFYAQGENARTRIVSRERSYHGVNFGGTSLGGLPNNQRGFGPFIPGTEHRLPLPYDPAQDRFCAGMERNGESYADALETICAEVGGETIAAVIVEPMTGSGGVYPAPKNYLQRLRAICDRHGILLVFDEVITGFGRLGYAFAAERYGVTPDLITFAKGVSNGSVPMGGVIVKENIRRAFDKAGDHAIDFFHGYTYTAHPLAVAAALATLDLYRDEGLFERARAIEPLFREAVLTLKDEPFVADIRNVGLAAAIELEPIAGAIGQRGYSALTHAFFEEDLALRVTGDTIVLIPSLIVSEAEITRMVDGVRKTLKAVQ